MTNTGNIGIVTHGKVTLKAAGGGPIVKVKTKRIKPGHTKVAHFKIPVDQSRCRDLPVGAVVLQRQRAASRRRPSRRSAKART
jgi:hypothetical protein